LLVVDRDCLMSATILTGWFVLLLVFRFFLGMGFSALLEIV